MSFLKKLGQLLAKGVAIYTGFAPYITQQFPGTAGTVQVISADLAQIADIVVQIEQIGIAMGTQGADKLKMAAPLVAQVILKSSVLAKNKKIQQPALFSEGCTKIADGMVAVLNSLSEEATKVVVIEPKV